jgi:AcrR family transcriptional regulator
MSEPGSRVIDPEEAGGRVLDGVIAEEMGEEIIDSLRRVRHAEETRYRAEHPGEGLRERKRRLTRHLISDAATAMFASRGFDAVKVSEIADRVNVSMKTLYNYFPTKESMVLDEADEFIDGLATALRDRPSGTSITDAFVGALEANMSGSDLLDDELAAHVATTFAAPPNNSPSRPGQSQPIPSRRSPAGRSPAWCRSTWTRGRVTSAPVGAASSCATRSPATYAKPRNCWRPDWHRSAVLAWTPGLAHGEPGAAHDGHPAGGDESVESWGEEHMRQAENADAEAAGQPSKGAGDRRGAHEDG